jgi:hypothetical protein
MSVAPPADVVSATDSLAIDVPFEYPICDSCEVLSNGLTRHCPVLNVARAFLLIFKRNFNARNVTHLVGFWHRGMPFEKKLIPRSKSSDQSFVVSFLHPSARLSSLVQHKKSPCVSGARDDIDRAASLHPET